MGEGGEGQGVVIFFELAKNPTMSIFYYYLEVGGISFFTKNPNLKNTYVFFFLTMLTKNFFYIFGLLGRGRG